MRRLAVVGLLGLALGLSGCAATGQRLSAQSSTRERGSGTLVASGSPKKQGPSSTTTRLAAKERPASGADTATSAAPTQAQPEGLNRYFPAFHSRNNNSNDAVASSRGATAPPAPSPTTESQARGAIPMPDEAAMETGEAPADLPITLTVQLHPASNT